MVIKGRGSIVGSVGRLLTIGAVLAAVLQFAVLVIYSLNRFNHFDVGIDYAMFNQATYLISHGHLNPFNTIYTDRFWQDQFNLMAWPIGLLRTVFSSSLMLLYLQALGIASATFLLIRFAIVETESDRYSLWYRLSLVGGVTVLVMLNPWAYEADSFDVHVQTIFATFILGGLFAFWRGMGKTGFLLFLLALSGGTSASLLVIGVGVGMFFVKRLRKYAVLLTLISVVWTVLNFILHAHQGMNFTTTYGYLAQSPGYGPVSVLGAAMGIIFHPSLPIRVLASRFGDIYPMFEYSGFAGILFPPTAIAAILEILVGGLASNGAFIGLVQGFQSYPAVVILTFGGVVVSNRLVSRVKGDSSSLPYYGRRGGQVLPGVVISLVCVVVGVQGLIFDSHIPPYWLTVRPSQADVLKSVPLAKSDEVIATMNIMGRYGSRALIYGWFANPQTYHVCANHVDVVILDNVHTMPISDTTVSRAIYNLSHAEWARLVASGHGVWVFRAILPKGYQLVLPQASARPSSSGYSCPNA